MISKYQQGEFHSLLSCSGLLFLVTSIVGFLPQIRIRSGKAVGGGGGEVLTPHLPLLFDENPASRTSFIAIPIIVFFPNPAKIETMYGRSSVNF